MKFYRSFRFRVYPTPAQSARLAAWGDALRWLWNLAHEQRLLAYGRADRRYPSAFDQQRELTELRACTPWLADVPRHVAAHVLVDLDHAWQRCFTKLARAPHWKRKGDQLAICEFDQAHQCLRGSAIHFPKLGALRAVVHRPLAGKPKTCTLKADGDQWFAVIVCELDIAEPAQRAAPVVAIDRGITNLLADSDGVLVPGPRHLEHSLKRLARAQRTVSRRKKGSKRHAKAKRRVTRIHRKVRRQREHHLHVLSSSYAKSHGVVVVENLNVSNMVRVGGGLGRNIGGAGWGAFASMLRYKLAATGGRLVEVPAAFSSQTCAVCEAVDAASRSGERFVCTACGHEAHADTNAARVLLARANRSGLLVEGSALAARRSEKPRVKLRTARKLRGEARL